MGAKLPPRPFLYPIVDVGVVAESQAVAAVGALARLGCALIQLRAKRLSDRRWAELARAAVAAAHGSGGRLIVNDRPDVALVVGADGVHLGQDDLPPGDARRLLGADAVIGLSTHNADQLGVAADAPVDYLAIGPVFETRSKERPDPVVGLDGVARARTLTARPLVAIGGVSRANGASVLAAGADGLAVIGDLWRDPDLSAAVRAFQTALAV